MTTYTKIQPTIEAVRWFKNGDHPKDDVFRPFEDTGKVPTEPREGKVVRYYRRPTSDGQDRCVHCNEIMHVHGWIDTIHGDRVVCPGDYVITEEDEVYTCKPDLFEKLYIKLTPKSFTIKR